MAARSSDPRTTDGLERLTPLGATILIMLAILATACQESQLPEDEPAVPIRSSLRKPVSKERQAALERWRRDRDEGRAIRPIVAAATEYRGDAKAPAVIALHLGDGWGCATIHDGSHYCWDASKLEVGENPEIVAQHVPRLDGQWIGVGPDRLCFAPERPKRALDAPTVPDDSDITCWQAPQFLSRPKRAWQWPTAAGRSDGTSWRLDWSKGDLIWDRTPVVHGAWRGCSGDFCWGAVEPSSAPRHRLCRAGALAVPCDIADEHALREFAGRHQIGEPLVGDLFGCVRTAEDVLCIGASRDGIFGSQQDCPAWLLRAWPTATGTVAAPKAKCSRRPLSIGPVGSGDNDSASPRAICLEQSISGIRCLGAISTPSRTTIVVALGLGDEPSACRIEVGGPLRCWGAGYTRPRQGIREVTVRFELPQRDIVAWDGNGPFYKKCNIHRNCGSTAQPFPPCPDHAASLDVSDALAFPEGTEGQVMSVRGALILPSAPSFPGQIACGLDLRKGGPAIDPDAGQGNYCCPDATVVAVIANGLDWLPIEGIECQGDTSRLCCNAPVLGQQVIATGRLTFRSWVKDIGPAWNLANAELCQVDRSVR